MMAGPRPRTFAPPGRPVPLAAGRTDEADDDEERRSPPPSERRPGRPRRRRQDDARRAAAVQGRGDPQARPRRRRDGPSRLRARGAEAQGVAEPRGRDLRVGRDADLAGRHARLPGLHRRRHRGFRGERRRDLRHGRVGRRRGRPRARRSRSGAGRTPRPASSSTRATARTRTRRPPSTRCGRASATRSRRSRSRSARPRRSRATSTSSTARRGAGTARPRRRSRSPTTSPARSSRRRDQLLEAAAEADDDVLTKYLEGEEISDPELEACLRKGVKESILAPVLVGSAVKGIGLRGLLDAIVRYLPSPGRRAAGQGRRTSPARRSRSRPTRTARCSSACSRRPPTRSSAG